MRWSFPCRFFFQYCSHLLLFCSIGPSRWSFLCTIVSFFDKVTTEFKTTAVSKSGLKYAFGRRSFCVVWMRKLLRPKKKNNTVINRSTCTSMHDAVAATTMTKEDNHRQLELDTQTNPKAEPQLRCVSSAEFMRHIIVIKKETKLPSCLFLFSSSSSYDGEWKPNQKSERWNTTGITINSLWCRHNPGSCEGR